MSQYYTHFTERYNQVWQAPSIACKFYVHPLQYFHIGITKSALTSTMKSHIEVKCLLIPRDKVKTMGTELLSKFFQKVRQEYTQEEVIE